MKNEKEKMLAGELYDPLDPQLCRERDPCCDSVCLLLSLYHAYNHILNNMI